MRVIFMGTPDFAYPTLQALIDSEHKITAVYTQAPKKANRGMKLLKSKIHQLAEENSLTVKTPTSLKDEDEIKKFKSFNADIAVVAAYGMLLPKEILEGTKHGCINIHPSKLPRWRGAAPIQRTLINGDKETEICIMQMDEGLDTGDIILKESLELDNNINAGELHDIAAKKGAKLVLEVIKKFESGKVEATPQIDEGITYAKKITKKDEQINFDDSAENIHNLIRGLSPYPTAHFAINGIKYKIYKADFEIKDSRAKSGTIVHEDFHIACKDGVIKILEIQKEGKKRVPIKDFLNGNKVETGKKVDDI